MPSKESRIWSDSGVEPDPGEETYSGSEKPIAEYDNWAMWALTTDVDSLFDAVGDLDGVSGVTEVTAGLNADKPDVANVSNGHLYIATDAGYADIATSDSWARIATTSYDDLSGAYDDSDARTAVEGNVDAAALTGDSGTDGQVLETDGAAAAWSDPPDARSDEEIEDVVATLLAAGDKLSWAYDDGNDTLTVNTSALDQEEVEDTVASLISTGSNLTFNYDDAGDALTIGLASDISVNAIDAASVSADALEADDGTFNDSITDPAGTQHTTELAESADLVDDHSNLTNVQSDQHHTKTDSASDLTDVSADSVSDAHHAKTVSSDVTVTDTQVGTLADGEFLKNSGGSLTGKKIPIGIESPNDISGSRSYNTSYTNNTGNPLVVYVLGEADGSFNEPDHTMSLEDGSGNILQFSITNNYNNITVGAIISDGDSYKVKTSGTLSLKSWFEREVSI